MHDRAPPREECGNDINCLKLTQRKCDLSFRGAFNRRFNMSFSFQRKIFGKLKTSLCIPLALMIAIPTHALADLCDKHQRRPVPTCVKISEGTDSISGSSSLSAFFGSIHGRNETAPLKIRSMCRQPVVLKIDYKGSVDKKFDLKPGHVANFFGGTKSNIRTIVCCPREHNSHCFQ